MFKTVTSSTLLVHIMQATLLVLALIATTTAHADVREHEQSASHVKYVGHTLQLDVVQNATDFFFEGPVNENGIPAKGTPFVTTGFIYPAGTLAVNGASSGITANGEPEFPELVIGTWTCRGWHLQDGDAESGVVVVTTQTFDFDKDNPGRQMIVTDGIELADFNVPFVRPITGGSGQFGRFKGQMEQTYLDFNASGGFNMTFTVSRR